MRVYILYASLVLTVILDFRSIGLFKQSSKHNKEERSQMQFSKAVYQDSNDTTETTSTPTTSNETYGLAENSTTVYAVVNKMKTPKISNEMQPMESMIIT